MKESFLMRSISDSHKIKDVASIDINRSRDSKGYSSIEISIRPLDEKHRNQTILFSSAIFGSHYEHAAKMFAEMILKICEDPCELPILKNV